MHGVALSQALVLSKLCHKLAACQGRGGVRCTQGRRTRSHAISPQVLLDNSFGTDGEIQLPLPKDSLAAASCGLHRKTARRGRSIRSAALHHHTSTALEKHLKLRQGLLAVKLQRDEQTLRMYLPNGTVRSIFARLAFTEKPDTTVSKEGADDNASNVNAASADAGDAGNAVNGNGQPVQPL